jgi:hypothetical protein
VVLDPVLDVLLLGWNLHSHPLLRLDGSLAVTSQGPAQLRLRVRVEPRVGLSLSLWADQLVARHYIGVRHGIATDADDIVDGLFLPAGAFLRNQRDRVKTFQTFVFVSAHLFAYGNGRVYDAVLVGHQVTAVPFLEPALPECLAVADGRASQLTLQLLWVDRLGPDV